MGQIMEKQYPTEENKTPPKQNIRTKEEKKSKGEEHNSKKTSTITPSYEPSREDATSKKRRAQDENRKIESSHNINYTKKEKQLEFAKDHCLKMEEDKNFMNDALLLEKLSNSEMKNMNGDFRHKSPVYDTLMHKKEIPRKNSRMDPRMAQYMGRLYIEKRYRDFDSGTYEDHISNHSRRYKFSEYVPAITREDEELAMFGLLRLIDDLTRLRYRK